MGLSGAYLKQTQRSTANLYRQPSIMGKKVLIISTSAEKMGEHPTGTPNLSTCTWFVTRRPWCCRTCYNGIFGLRVGKLNVPRVMIHCIEILYSTNYGCLRLLGWSELLEYTLLRSVLVCLIARVSSICAVSLLVGGPWDTLVRRLASLDNRSASACISASWH